MKSLDHIREKAIELRYEGYSLPDICNMLHRSKGTVHYWLKDILLQRKKMEPDVQKMWNGNKNKWKLLRDEAYETGLSYYKNNKNDSLFRDFIIIYLTEGFRASNKCVEVTNANLNIIKNCKHILERFTNKISYRIMSYIDKDEENVRKFWANGLKIETKDFKYYIKTGGDLKGRDFASKFGTMKIIVHDFKLRMQIQAWMDELEKEWKML